MTYTFSSPPIISRINQFKLFVGTVNKPSRKGKKVVEEEMATLPPRKSAADVVISVATAGKA